MYGFNQKNITPQRLALINAVIIGLVVSIITSVYHTDWRFFFIILMITTFTSFIIFFYSLQFFIYRKIKLIYKLITDTKATKREEFYYKTVIPQKSIEEVNEDVAKWAIRKEKEITNLKDNEEYRKEFLMNFAHEIRTPVFTVQGYIYTLLGGAIDDANVNRHFLENAAKGIDRLASLTYDIEQISKLESGKIPLVLNPFDIVKVIKDVFEELELSADKKNIDLEFKKGSLNQLTVMADKEKIKQVVINLVNNAIKYCPNESKVTASIYTLGDNKCLIEISDNGNGIEDHHLKRIFERFYRVDASRSIKLAGTGLGLSIVKHIIEAHNQTITVRSTVKVGTTFAFTLDTK